MSQEQYFEEQEESIDFKKYIFKALSKWYWFAISLFVCLAISYLYATYTIPTYSVSSSLILRQRAADMNGMDMIVEELGLKTMQRRKAVVENEVSILQSYSYAARAIDKVDFEVTYMGHGYIRDVYMYKRAPFIVKYDSLLINKTGSPIFINIIDESSYELEIRGHNPLVKTLSFGERFKNENFDFYIFRCENISITSYKSYSFYFNDVNDLINSYRNRINIEANDKKGTVLTLSTSGFVAEQEADYLNALMSEYLNADLEEKNDQSQKTINFIDNQISQMQDSLKIAEDELQFYRSNKKIINLKDEGRILYEKLRLAEEQKNILSMQQSFLDTLNSYIFNSTKTLIAPSIVGIEDPVLSSLIANYNLVLGRKRQINYSVMANSPEIIQLNDQLLDYKEALLSNIHSSLGKNRASLIQVNKKLDAIERQMQGLPINEQQLMNIQRKFDLSNNLYNFLLEKRAEQGIASSTNSPDHKILDWAMAENSILTSPKKSKIYLMGLILGLLFPSGIIVLLDLLNNKIETVKDVELLTKINIIGQIAKNNYKTEMPVIEHPKSSFAEAYRSIRTQLGFMLPTEKTPVIMVSSAVSGEGKTFSALNLASVFALGNKKTLLIGLDLRRPKLHNIFNVSNGKGISTYLIGKDKFDDVIIKTNVNNLFIAASGPVPPNPAELIESEKMDMFIEQAKAEFDIVIIDTPPYSIVTDAFLIKKHADVSLFVVRQEYTTRDLIKQFDKMAKADNLKNAAIIFNDTNLSGIYRYGYKYANKYRAEYGYMMGYYEE